MTNKPIARLQRRGPSASSPETREPPAERALIAAIRHAAGHSRGQAAAGGALQLGIGDDCAILRPRAGEDFVVTTDLFLEQVHFRRDWHQPEVAGHRCLARGLSDIAAMGATPLAAFLSMALPIELAGDWTQRFVAGLLRLARLHGVPLAGGDTSRAPDGCAGSSVAKGRRRNPCALFAADIVLLGSVERGKALRRSGARPGDLIYVTGALGGAAAELAMLEQTPAKYERLLRMHAGHPHLFPEPRLSVGRLLAGRATAAIDLSDGLSTDLAHLCAESGLAAEVEAALLPIHPLAVRQPETSLARALHGGEDYELLFTVPPGRRMAAMLAGVPIRRIGTMVKTGRGRPRIVFVGSDGTRKPLRNQGWEHLR